MACFTKGTPTKRRMELFTGAARRSEKRDVTPLAFGLFEGLGKYFEAQGNCDEKFAFAYHSGTVAGVYIGDDPQDTNPFETRRQNDLRCPIHDNFNVHI